MPTARSSRRIRSRRASIIRASVPNTRGSRTAAAQNTSQSPTTRRSRPFMRCRASRASSPRWNRVTRSRTRRSARRRRSGTSSSSSISRAAATRTSTPWPRARALRYEPHRRAFWCAPRPRPQGPPPVHHGRCSESGEARAAHARPGRGGRRHPRARRAVLRPDGRWPRDPAGLRTRARAPREPAPRARDGAHLPRRRQRHAGGANGLSQPDRGDGVRRIRRRRRGGRGRRRAHGGPAARRRSRLHTHCARAGARPDLSVGAQFDERARAEDLRRGERFRLLRLAQRRHGVRGARRRGGRCSGGRQRAGEQDRRPGPYARQAACGTRGGDRRHAAGNGCNLISRADYSRENMSWFEKLLPSKIRTEGKPKKSIPEGLWTKCEACTAVLYRSELERSLDVCPKCSHHMRIGARRRLDTFLDREPREEIGNEVEPQDVLKFRDSKKYRDRLLQAQKNTGERDALIVIQGQVKGVPLVACAFEFAFMGGSMGAVVGERFVRAVDACLEHKIPLVCFSASGGARMQEALYSLMQMAKTSAALARLSKKGIPYISVLTDPTMGGVSASFAMLGDINIGEPNALIGFDGPREIEQTVRENLHEGYQRSEFLDRPDANDMND